MQVNLQWNLYSNTKIHCDTNFKPDLHKPTVLKHLRPAESGEGAAGLSVLTCPGETSGGTPCSTLTKPICRFTAQSTGALLLVRPSPQSSLYTLRSCWSTITHTHTYAKQKTKTHNDVKLCHLFLLCVCLYVCVLPSHTQLSRPVFLLKCFCSSQLHTAVCSHTPTRTDSQTGLETHAHTQKAYRHMNTQQCRSTISHILVNTIHVGVICFMLLILLRHASYRRRTLCHVCWERSGWGSSWGPGGPISEQQHPYTTTVRQNAQTRIIQRRFPSNFLTSRSCWPPVSLTTALRPRTGESPVSNLKSGREIKTDD